MANSDKDILITTNKGSTTDDPKIEFKGASSSVGPSTITVRAYPTSSGTVSFEGSAGQLFSVTNNLTSGSIYSVNDVSGIPSIDVNADGTVLIAPYNGNIGFGTATPTSKFHFVGNVTLSGNLTASGQNAIVNQDNGNSGQWYGRILSINSTSQKAAFLGTYAGIAGVFAHNHTLNAWEDLYINTVDGTAGGSGSTSIIMPGVTVESGAIYTSSDSSINNVYVGRGWGNITSNTVLGTGSLGVNSTGFDNTAIGYGSLSNNITGQANTAVGDGALAQNSSGNYNTAIGCGAMQYISGNTSDNIAIGYCSLQNNTTGFYNVAIGNFSLYYNYSGTNNTTIGYASLRSSTGSSNTAIGSETLYSNTTTGGNTAIGHRSMYTNNTGYNNTAVGFYSLYSNVNGYLNTAVGGWALYVNTGNLNTAVGYEAGRYNTSGGNNLFLGYGATNTAGGITASNTIVLGNSSITTLRCNTATISGLSDQRDKKDIENIPLGLSFLNELRPVKFTWNQRDGGRVNLPDSGFIAQEALKVIEKYDAEWFGLVDHQNPEHFEMASAKLIPVIVKAIQELFVLINKQEE